MSEIQRLQDELGEWSDETFGHKTSPLPALFHLQKEVQEVVDNPADKVEYADCLMLLLDAYRNTGGTADELVAIAFNKLEVNKQREWGPPDENGVCEHVRTPVAASPVLR